MIFTMIQQILFLDSMIKSTSQIKILNHKAHTYHLARSLVAPLQKAEEFVFPQVQQRSSLKKRRFHCVKLHLEKAVTCTLVSLEAASFQEYAHINAMQAHTEHPSVLNIPIHCPT